MKYYHFIREQTIPTDLAKAWDFFSSPANLATITPEELKFEIISDLQPNAEIYEGQLIRYRVRPMLGIPITWVTQIKDVAPLRRFTDIQLKGPYALWEHIHHFRETSSGVLMTDEIRYALPFGMLGRWMHRWVVARKLQNIFDYRKQMIEQIFIKNQFR